MEEINIGILTASDRASQGIYQDLSGPAIEDYFKTHINNPVTYLYKLVADEQAEIARALTELSDEKKCCLILTTGGTGPALRDVTVEATEEVCHKILPGFGEQMRAVSLHYVPTAILSRQTAGIRHQSLIINLPGKPKSIAECLDAVFGAIPYCIDLIGGPYLQSDDPRVFRPKA